MRTRSIRTSVASTECPFVSELTIVRPGGTVTRAMAVGVAAT